MPFFKYVNEFLEATMPFGDWHHRFIYSLHLEGSATLWDIRLENRFIESALFLLEGQIQALRHDGLPSEPYHWPGL